MTVNDGIRWIKHTLTPADIARLAFSLPGDGDGVSLAHVMGQGRGTRPRQAVVRTGTGCAGAHRTGLHVARVRPVALPRIDLAVCCACSRCQSGGAIAHTPALEVSSAWSESENLEKRKPTQPKLANPVTFFEHVALIDNGVLHWAECRRNQICLWLTLSNQGSAIGIVGVLAADAHMVRVRARRTRRAEVDNITRGAGPCVVEVIAHGAVLAGLAFRC